MIDQGAANKKNGMKNLDELRKKLDELTTYPADAKADWLDSQVNEIEQLKKLLPHSIELFRKATVEIVNTNCYMYSLDLSYESIEEYVEDKSDIPNSKFVAWLITEGILMPLLSDFAAAEDGVIVLYFQDGTFGVPAHAGKKAGDKVVSKWGWGLTHTWKHAPLQCPAQYGNRIKLYIPPESIEVKSAYYSWLATHSPSSSDKSSDEK